jgi:DnaJ-class molecular chaperone
MIRYGYKKKCMCEEVCMTCKGTGVESSSRCSSCYGNGWVHYCSDCEGKGSYLKKEEYELSLPYGQLIDKEILVENRGDQINSHKRGPLLLSITFLDNVKQLRPNLFTYTVYTTPSLLKQPFIEIYLSKHLTVKIMSHEIKQIPHYQNLTEVLNVNYNNQKVKLILKLKLKLD